MAKTAADLILLSRQKSNTQRSKFVDDAEVLTYVNEGRNVLRDLVISADPSYYSAQFDLVFDSPAGQPAGSAALPSNIYKIRGVSQNPDTDDRRPIHPLAFSDRDGRGFRREGYTMNGDYLTLVPSSLAQRGPVRVYVTPKLLPLAVPLPITDLTPGVDGPITVTSGTDRTNAPSDYIFSGVPHGGLVGQSLRTSGWTNATNNKTQARITAFNSVTGAITVADTDLVSETATGSVTADLLLFNQQGGTWSALGFATVQPKPGDTLVVTGGLNPGSYTILTASGTSLTTDATGLVDETFGPGVTVAIQPAGTVGALDVTLDNFDSFLSTYAAIRIATKAIDPDRVALLTQQLAADEQRVNQMAAVRAGEPESIPVLWRPDGVPGVYGGGEWGW